MKRINPGFSFTYSCIFGAISAFAGFLFSGQEGTNFEYLYVYTALGGFIGGYLVSSWLIVKPNNYSNSRLIISGVIIGFVSPYTCWLIAFSFDSLINKETGLKFVENLIMMILSPAFDNTLLISRSVVLTASVHPLLKLYISFVSS